jgi:hypothetical protein
LVFGVAITLLKAPFELILLAGDDIEIIIGQLAPLLFHFALDLLPISFDPVPIHDLLLRYGFDYDAARIAPTSIGARFAVRPSIIINRNALLDVNRTKASALPNANDRETDVTANVQDDWWRHGIFYQVYPRSFQDSDGDGVGDLRGIVRRLPYVASLGVDAVWLSPIISVSIHCSARWRISMRCCKPRTGSG